MKRIAILYSNLSGYTAACQRAVKEAANAELLVIHWPVAKEAPYDDHIFGHIDYRYSRDQYTAHGIVKLLSDFSPDVVIMSGWMDNAYLQAARYMRRKGVPVVAGSDTQWNGSLRQRSAALTARWYLHPAIDILWVTGERQRYLAGQLGYTTKKCWTGFYTCDWEKFNENIGIEVPREKAFLYVGRYIDRKGMKTLLSAYQSYRSEVSDPWKLWTVGTGAWSKQIQDIKGVQDWGFVQPDRLPQIMRTAGAFILPSLYEPWGVVLHEAATAGLPLLASNACGAAVHLLRDQYNGYVHESGDDKHLTESMVRLAGLSADQLAQFSLGSHSLSKQYTPHIWAETLISNLWK